MCQIAWEACVLRSVNTASKCRKLTPGESFEDIEEKSEGKKRKMILVLLVANKARSACRNFRYLWKALVVFVIYSCLKRHSSSSWDGFGLISFRKRRESSEYHQTEEGGKTCQSCTIAPPSLHHLPFGPCRQRDALCFPLSSSECQWGRGSSEEHSFKSFYLSDRLQYNTTSSEAAIFLPNTCLLLFLFLTLRQDERSSVCKHCRHGKGERRAE